MTASHPSIDKNQNLLRLQNHLLNLPNDLLKHVHLARVRQEDPRLFFSALEADLNGL